MSALLVPRRFCGPPASGNGGWTAGALAALVDHDCPADRSDAWPTIEVTLHAPPVLDEPMPVSTEGEHTVATRAGLSVATARVVDRSLTPVEPVDADQARAAEPAYPGLRSHPFPTCFVCGTGREAGDGLRIFPGPMATTTGRPRVAATWTPHASLSEDWHSYADDHRLASLAVTWAALDCTGGWAGDLEERPMVLGRITARVDTLPIVGEVHVVVGEGRGREGRKTATATTMYDAVGRLVAVAEHVWISVDPATFAAPASRD